MRKIQQKARLEEPKPIIVQIDPSEPNAEIINPKVEYRIVSSVVQDQVFQGMIIPIPKVLLYYLMHKELLLLSIIMEESAINGTCRLTVKELAIRLKVTIPTVSNTLYNLRKAGILLEAPNGKKGTGRNRKINFSTIQHLNDLVQGQDPGIYSRIRKATKKKDISHLTLQDLSMAYDNKVLAPGHDPAEEEEYD